MNGQAHDARRELLRVRCQRERNELIAARTAALAWAPRARSAQRWIRLAARLLRGIAAHADAREGNT